MLYDYNTEYMTEISVACYDGHINSIGKIGLSFNMSIVNQVSCPNGNGYDFPLQGS